LPKEEFGGFGITPWLNEDIDPGAVLIHGGPKIMLHVLDPDEYLVEVPLILWPRSAAAQTVGEALPEFLAPSRNGLKGDHDDSFNQKRLDVRRLRPNT
jgi:hypothetical protein